MQIENLLKQLKKIEPRAGYTLHSRQDILNSAQNSPRIRFSWKAILAGMAQSGSATAFTVLMLMIFAGGFSVMRFLETTGGLDPQSLKAEAQAIDIQIQLAKVSYDNFGSTGTDAMKVRAQAAQGVRPIPTLVMASTSTSSGSATSTEIIATTTTDMTVDEALDALSRP